MKKLENEIKINIIDLYNSGESMKSIGLALLISPATVKKVLDLNGVNKRTKGGIYKLSESTIIELYKSGLSCYSIADMYKVTPKTITNLLEKNNITRDNYYHNLNLDNNYWSSINSFDKAYFLGFLLADGNVYNNQVKLELGIKDAYILYTFSKYTNNDNKIILLDRENKGKFAAFSVKRDTWVKDLQKYNVVPNKTYNCKIPDDIPDLYMSHFIRGLIDGDGWISEKSTQIGFCGALQCVTLLKDYLVDHLHVYNVKVLQIGKHLWQVCWCSKNDISTIGNYIYSNKLDCYLVRKFNNWLKIQGNTEVTSKIAKGLEAPLSVADE